MGRGLSGATATAVVLGVVAAAAGGCATPRTLDGIVIATVNEEPFTAQDLEDDYTTIHGGHTTMLLAGRGAVREFLDKALDRRLLVQEAYRIGLDRDPAIQGALRHIRRSRAREGLLKDRVESPVPIESADLQRAADGLKSVFDVRRIVVLTREDAEAALGRVKAGEDFGQVSGEVSLGEGDRRRGGLLIGVSWSALPPEVEEHLYALQEGEISEPFSTREGWTILKVQRRIEREVDLGKARPAIENAIRTRTRQARLEELRGDLMRRWKPTIHEGTFVAATVFGETPPDVVLVEVGDERIGLREFRSTLPLDMLRRLPEAVALFRIRRILEENVLFDRLLILEGLRLGYGDRPEVERELGRIRNGMLLERIVTEFVYAEVSVTDDEVAVYYRDHPKEFSDPSRAKVRSILAADEAEAGLLQAALGEGKDFAALARERSKDPLTSSIGGEMGWLVEGRARLPFAKIVFTLPVGEVAVAKDGDGYRVVQVTAREEARLRPLDEVSKDARAKALAAKQFQEARRWVGKLRQASTIQIFEGGIVEAEQAFQEQVKAKLQQRTGSKN